MAAEKPVGEAWLAALDGQDLDVRSARDALQVQGWLDTGNYALNWAISGRFLRGLPLGHTIEIFGDPSTGKSFLVTRALARAQQQGGVCLLDDTEGAYNLEWISSLGLSPDHLAYRRSRTVRNHLDTTRQFIDAYRGLREHRPELGPGVLACDSLSLLSTEHEREVGLEKRDMTKAAELKAFFRIVGGDLVDLPIVHISTSHTIANIGGWNSRTTSGGGGPKFQASVRLDLRAASKIKSGQDYVGTIARVVVDKNRIVAPWKEVRLAIPFYQPISPLSGLIPVLLDLGILETKGQFLQYRGEKTGLRAYTSKQKFLQQDESAEELLAQYPTILEEADAALAEAGTPSPEGPWEEGERDADPEPDPDEVESP